MDLFTDCGNQTLEALAQLLRSGEDLPGLHRLESSLGRPLALRLEAGLKSLSDKGWATFQIAELVMSLVHDRQERSRNWSWVVSGPSQDGVPTRDTGVVYRSLVQEAEKEILLTSYALHRGRELLEPLWNRMQEVPGLRVRMILDVSRPYKDSTMSDVIVTRFAKEFAKKHWPENPLPEVWYDPRALEEDSVRKAVLHAKCVIVDRSVALVTSANLTHAAQQKNIEAGVLVRDPEKASQLQDFFEGHMESGILRRLELQAK